MNKIEELALDELRAKLDVLTDERSRYEAVLKYVFEQIAPRLSKRQLADINDILTKGNQ